MNSNGVPPPANFVPREDFENVSKKLQECEAEKLQFIKDQGNMMKEFNRRMHVNLEEIRLLKDVNHKLQADVQELRDLCCYLDDDRQKCRKLAREWQRFGRYTASVMRNEVATYQEKLQTLEEKQSEMTKDNLELKELCLYVEKQRESLSSTALCSKCSRETSGPEHLDAVRVENGPYSKRLEAKLTDIRTRRSGSREESVNMEKKAEVAKKRVSFTFPEDVGDTDTDSNSDIRIAAARSPSRHKRNGIQSNGDGHTGILRNGIKAPPKQIPFPENDRMTPEAVANAMRVLEIHEKLGHSDQLSGEEDDEEVERLGDNEVAVLKEMCNVVWRKLSDDDHIENGIHKEDDDFLEDLL